VALDFLACGLDPGKATLFRQSDVPEVAELAWLLTCMTPMPMLENCHAYKDYRARQAAEQKLEPPGHGLFAYPVLMAADILAYQSDIVPVGRDQKQHVEVTRDLAEKWNRTFGTTFRLPVPSILPEAAAIPGLDGQKMSKSYGNTIGIFEEEKRLRKSIMGMVTDSTPVDAPKDPEGSPLLPLYRLFASKEDAATMESQYREGGVGYGEFKKRLFEAIWEYFSPMRTLRAALEADPGYLDGVLKAGGEKARTLAAGTMVAVRSAAGLR
jgi:tryptophanyl-tRNA synthetase